MRYILIILVFLSVGAKSQMVIKAHANYRPYAQPAANLLLDDYPNAAAAYSLRKLDKDYTGAAIRVRKDTTGQPEQDIGFTASGDLDTAALKSFLNARSGFVTTWYDQSGSNNLTQSTQANQPAIVKNGVIERAEGKVIVDFRTTSGQFLENSNLSPGTPKTIFTVYKKGVNQSGEEVFFDSRITSQHLAYKESSTLGNRLNIAFGTNQRSNHTIQSQEYKLLSIIQDGANGNAYINGSSIYSSNVNFGSNDFNGLRVGAVRGTAALYLTAGLYELIIYGSNQSSNRTGIENNINDYYNIYWNGDFTGILDTYPNSAAAYSLRNLSSTYTGPLIRVRKDTTGQPEMDIYGDYYGNLDTVGLKNFLLTRSGFVTTWYDQSGNGRNATQSTQANQPRIANLGVIERQGSRPTIVWDGSNDNFDIIAFAVGNVYSLYYAQKRRTSGVRGVYLCGNSTGGGANFVHWSDNNIYLQYFLNSDGTGPRYRSVADNTSVFNLLEGYKTSTTQNVYKNNSELVLSAQLSFTSQSSNWNSIGEYQNSNYSDGNCSEIILYSSDQLSNRSGITTNINTYYGIY